VTKKNTNHSESQAEPQKCGSSFGEHTLDSFATDELFTCCLDAHSVDVFSKGLFFHGVTSLFVVYVI